MTWVGHSQRRLEDPPLLSGVARFAADIEFSGQLHMRVVRSPMASGRIQALEISAAQDVPEVYAVWTSEDVVDIPPIGLRMTHLPELEQYRQPVLAHEFVRYVGEPVAVVFAEDAYTAEDGAGVVFADIDPGEPVLDVRRSGTFAPGVGNEAAVLHKETGDISAAFDAADHLVELELSVGRHSGVPMETRGALAWHDRSTGVLHMYGAAKVPHYNRAAIASMLGLHLNQVQLHEGHVGGGFGIRGELYPEDVLVCAAALRLGRPVRWIEDRREHLIAANHSRDQVHQVRAAVRSDGFILGIDDEFWLDQGAYVRTHGATVPDLTAAMLPGPYLVPAYRVVGHVVLTNKTPAGTYRSPGRFEGTFVRERLVDAVAHRLDLDPIAVRRTNLIPTEAMPFDRDVDALGTHVIYDSGDYTSLMDQTLQTIPPERLRSEAAALCSDEEVVGIGAAFFVEKSGLGPYDGVRVTVDESGGVEVVTGAASVGQGVETVVAQVCADALGVRPEAVRVVHGQTDRISHGMGAFASRVTAMTGSATHYAALAVRDKALSVAAEMLEAAIEDLVVENGTIGVRGSPGGPSVSLAEAAIAMSPVVRGGDGPAGLTAEEWFRSDRMSYPYGFHLAAVAVDPETGGCRVVKYVVAYDVGRAVNPQLVDGQLVGAAAQGIGGTLLEEFVYDDFGQPLASTFMDYLMPTAAEVPDVETLIFEEAPSPLNPLGVKGAGEGGLTASGAAIAAAIDDAIGSPLAVRRLPVTPNRLHDLIRALGDTT